jgi:hypothetical protein
MDTARTKIIILLILLSLSLVPEVLWSQQEKLKRALIFPKYGKGISGYVVGIRVGTEDDTLVLFSGRQTEKFLMEDLARVVVLPQNEGGNGFLHGALIGTYVSTWLLGQVNRYDRQPTAYLTETYSKGAGLLLAAFLGVGIGGGIGYFVKFSDGETSFAFTGSELEKRTSRRKFYELISGESDSRNFHFSVQGGHVYTQASKDFQNAMGSNAYGYGETGLSEFNWLRKVQLTYSVEPDIEIGGAVQWSGEPSISDWNYYFQSSGASLDVVGYYGVCKYKPFYSTLPSQTDFSVGGGIGIVNFNYQAYTRTNTGFGLQTVQQIVEERTLSAIVFGEFNYYFHESLSLGVVADFVYYPPKKVPAVANLPEQTIFGNGCIGFVLGLHY